MALYGSLKTMSLPDLLQWISSSPRDGTLSLITQHGEESLFFEKSEIVGYRRNGLRDETHQNFVSYENIGERRYHQLVSLHRRTGKSFEEIMVGEGWVLQDEIDRHICDIARESILALFAFDEGQFSYTDHEGMFDAQTSDMHPEDVARVRFTVRELILEGMRRLDEWEMVKDEFPPWAILRRGSAPPPDNLTGRGRRVLSAADRQVSVSELCLEMRYSLHSGYQAIRELLTTGVLLLDRQTEHPDNGGKMDRLEMICEQGENLLRNRQFGEAVSVFTTVLSVHPSHERAREGVRKVHMEQVRDLYETMSPVTRPRLLLEVSALHGVHLNSEEHFIASRVNGEWDVGTIVMQSPLPEVVTLKALKRLQELGVIA